MKKILVCVLVLVMCITAFVACNPTDGSTPDLSGLNSAKAYLQNQYREAATNTLADFERLATLKVGTASFTVEWTASVTSGPQTVTVVDNGDGTVTIDIEEVDETVTEDTLYTLTATITDANGNTTTLTYNHMIPKFAVNTFAEYVAAVAGDSIIIDGIVTGILPKGNGATNDGFYMNTLDGGGVYVYGTSGAELTVGQTVRVKGTKDVYNGTHELKDSTYEVIDANVTTVTPVDYTAIYTNAEDLKDEALVEKQALLVTIKGVTIGTVGGSDGSYYYFELAGKKSYIRISSSSCPMTTAEQTAFKEAFNANFGATADVTGLITLYSGSFYLTPVSASAISNIVAPELTDQQVVDGAKEALTIVDTIKDAGKVELPTAGTGVYSDAAITWALSTTTVATLEGNVLTVAALPEADVEVTLTATIAKGDATPATKEFTVKVCAPAESFIKKALTAGAALEHNTSTPDSYIIIGTVAEITSAYSEQYKNVTFTVTDGTNTIIIYRYNLDDAATIKAGDSIAIAAPIKKYNNDIEAVATFVKLEITSLKDAADAGIAGTGADGTMIYGKVKEITTAYSEQHNNITITLTDGTNDLSCYRLTGGADIAVGDYLLVTGTPSAYKGAAQMAQGATYNNTGIYVAPATPDPTPTPDPDPTPDPTPTPATGSVTYNFATSSTKKGTELNAESALALFTSSQSVDAGLTSVAVTKIYDGNGTGGAYPNQGGFIKTGTSKANGQLVLTFGSNVTKVEIKCHDFYNKSDDHPTNSNTVAVNGSATQLAPYTTDGTPAVLTFELGEASNVVTIDVAARVFIFEIVVYFADAQ